MIEDAYALFHRYWKENKALFRVLGYGLYLYFLDGLPFRNATKEYLLQMVKRTRFYLGMDRRIQTNKKRNWR